MIEKLLPSSTYLEQLNTNFKDVFTKINLKYDLENNEFTNYYVYIIDNKVVAFINYHLIYERCELININVLESYQNQKIASKLLEVMINDCKSNDIINITLEVNKTNTKAIHLYTKYGFMEVAIRKGYYNGIDGILMKKELM